MHDRKNSETGFTLIETMIVVAIIGIATALAVPNYLVWHSRSELRRGITEVQNQLLLARMAALSRSASRMEPYRRRRQMQRQEHRYWFPACGCLMS